MSDLSQKNSSLISRSQSLLSSELVSCVPKLLENKWTLLGDKWSPLPIRNILLSKHRYEGFKKSPEQIPTNILAKRLKLLIDKG